MTTVAEMLADAGFGPSPSEPAQGGGLSVASLMQEIEAQTSAALPTDIPEPVPSTDAPAPLDFTPEPPTPIDTRIPEGPQLTALGREEMTRANLMPDTNIQPTWTGSDAYRTFMAALDRGTGNVGMLMRLTGEKMQNPANPQLARFFDPLHIGDVLTAAGGRLEGTYRDNEAKHRAAQSAAWEAEQAKPFLQTEEGDILPSGLGEGFKSPAKLLGTLLSGMGETALGMGAGALITKAMLSAGFSTAASGLIGGMAGEGGTTTLSQYSDIHDMVMKAPQQQLATTPEYKAAVTRLTEDQPDMPEAQKGQTARRMVADGAAWKAGLQTGAWTAVFGAPSGVALAKLLKGEFGKTWIGTAMKQGGLESLQEVPQSGMEAYISGKDKRRYVDPAHDPLSGVPEASVAGGIAGFGMGAVMGGGAAAPRALADAQARSTAVPPTGGPVMDDSLNAPPAEQTGVALGAQQGAAPQPAESGLAPEVPQEPPPPTGQAEEPFDVETLVSQVTGEAPQQAEVPTEQAQEPGPLATTPEPPKPTIPGHMKHFVTPQGEAPVHRTAGGGLFAGNRLTLATDAASEEVWGKREDGTPLPAEEFAVSPKARLLVVATPEDVAQHFPSGTWEDADWQRLAADFDLVKVQGVPDPQAQGVHPFFAEAGRGDQVVVLNPEVVKQTKEAPEASQEAPKPPAQAPPGSPETAQAPEPIAEATPEEDRPPESGKRLLGGLRPTDSEDATAEVGRISEATAQEINNLGFKTSPSPVTVTKKAALYVDEKHGRQLTPEELEYVTATINEPTEVLPNLGSDLAPHRAKSVLLVRRNGKDYVAIVEITPGAEGNHLWNYWKMTPKKADKYLRKFRDEKVRRLQPGGATSSPMFLPSEEGGNPEGLSGGQAEPTDNQSVATPEPEVKAPPEAEGWGWYIDPNDRPVWKERSDAALSGLRGPYSELEVSELTGTDPSYMKKDGNPVYTPDNPAPKPTPAENKPPGAAQPPPRIAVVSTRELHVDPDRFQYKRGMGAGGVGSKLKGVQYNPDLAGILNVWPDPADGKTYVVNGHHRHNRAIRDNVEDEAVRYIQADSAKEARSIGALINIAENQGTAFDAAILFRDSGYTRKEIAESLPFTGSVAREGWALSRLAPWIFKAVEQEHIPKSWGVAIGDRLASHDDQKEVVRLVEKEKRRGRSISGATIEQLVSDLTGVSRVEESQATLFGEEQTSRPLLWERAELREYAVKKLSHDKRLFGTVGDSARAARLAEAGNIIEVGKSQHIARHAAQVKDVLDKLGSRAGPINDALNQFAEELSNASGRKQQNEVKARFLEALRAAVSRVVSPEAGSDTGSTGRHGAGGQPGSRQRGASRSETVGESQEEVKPSSKPASAGDTKTPAPKTLFGEPPPTTGGKTAANIDHYAVTEPNPNRLAALELPELVEVAQALGKGRAPAIKKRLGDAFGTFSIAKGGQIKLKAELGQEPAQLAYVLGHELGHWVDALPSDNLSMGKGNLLGRIAGVAKAYRKWTLGTGKDQLALQPVRKELLAVTQRLKPFNEKTAEPKYLKYRYSAKELYADAFTMLVNDPASLELLAPTFYKAFLAHVNSKPEFKALYDELQDRLRDPELVMEVRHAREREGFEEGRRLEKEREEEIERLTPSAREEAMRAVMDNYYQLYKLAKKGQNPTLKHLHEEMLYVGGRTELYLSKLKDKVEKPLKKLGIDLDDFGVLLARLRVAIGDRGKYANPHGETIETSLNRLKWLRNKWGDEKFNEAVEIAKKFFSLNKEIVKQAIEAGLLSDELAEMALENPAYAAIKVNHYIMSDPSGMGGSAVKVIHKQVGTLSTASNPYVATIINNISLQRAAAHKKALKELVDTLGAVAPEDVKKASRGKDGVLLEPNEPGMGLIKYSHKGKIVGYYVPQYISDMYEHDPVFAAKLGRFVQGANNIVKTMFTGRNPYFWIFNMPRDFFDSLANLPGGPVKVWRLVPHYFKTFNSARKRAFSGKLDPRTEEMLAAGALLPQTYRGGVDQLVDEMDQLQGQVNQVGVAKDTLSLRDSLKWLWDQWGNIGLMQASWSKQAAWSYLKTNYPHMEAQQRAHFVRNFSGDPNFLNRGRANKVMNNIFLFWNANIQGTRRSLGAFEESKAAAKGQKFYRSEWVWKATLYGLLPKVLMWGAKYGLMGLAAKELMDRLSRYYLENFIMIPVAETENGETVALRIPQPHLFQLLGGIMWNTLEAATGDGGAIPDLFGHTGAQVPGLTPALTVPVKLWQLLVEEVNPLDSWFKRPIVSDKAFKAGGMPLAEEVLRWGANQFSPIKIPKSGVEGARSYMKELVSGPLGQLIGKFVIVTKYGEREQMRETKKGVERDRARWLIARDKQIAEFINEHSGKPGGGAIAGLYKKFKTEGLFGGSEITPGQFRKQVMRLASRGGADSRLTELHHTWTNDAKVALLLDFHKRMKPAKFDALMRQAMAEGVLSKNAWNKFQLKRNRRQK